MVCRSILTRKPYLRAHPRAVRMYCQEVRARNGSLPHTSIAQNGIGIRIQFRPAPAISAKSCSVYETLLYLSICATGRRKTAHNKSLVVVFKLRKPTAGGIRGHSGTDGPFINGGRLVLLEKRRGNERFEDKPTTEVNAARFYPCQ